MEHNPYAPPRVEVSTPVLPPEGGDLASRGRRLVNLLIDTVGYYLLLLFVSIFMAAIDPRLVLLMTLGARRYLFVFAVIILYYLPSEALFGRTLGKLVTRTRTVSESGAAATFGQIFTRTVVRLIPFELFTFLGSPPVGLHDKWSRTRVIRNNPYA